MRWCYSSCSWLTVACCLVSGSLLCFRLSDQHSMLAASKQWSIHRPLPLNRMQEILCILYNQHCFLCLLILQMPPLEIMCVNQTLLVGHNRGLWLTLFRVLYGYMAMRPGWTRWLLNLAGLEQYTRDSRIYPILPCRKYMTKPVVMITISAFFKFMDCSLYIVHQNHTCISLWPMIVYAWRAA